MFVKQQMTLFNNCPVYLVTFILMCPSNNNMLWQLSMCSLCRMLPNIHHQNLCVQGTCLCSPSELFCWQNNQSAFKSGNLAVTKWGPHGMWPCDIQVGLCLGWGNQSPVQSQTSLCAILVHEVAVGQISLLVVPFLLQFHQLYTDIV
jgi:hypothetical protein